MTARLGPYVYKTLNENSSYGRTLTLDTWPMVTGHLQHDCDSAEKITVVAADGTLVLVYDKDGFDL